MWSAIASFLFAVIGWFSGIRVIGRFCTAFFAKPWFDFLNLKGQVHQEIVYNGEHRREG